MPGGKGGQRALSRVQERSYRRILRAARRLVEVAGVDELSMRALAAEADVSVRTIYNVVGDRDRVISALVQECFDDIDADLDASELTDPIERIWEAIGTSLDAYCQHVPQAIIAAVITDLHLNAAVAPRWTGRRFLLDAIEHAASTGALRDDLAPARLLDQAGPAHAHRLHQWAVGLIDDTALKAGVLCAYDVSLLAVARPKARARLLAHIEALEPHLCPLIIADGTIGSTSASASP